MAFFLDFEAQVQSHQPWMGGGNLNMWKGWAKIGTEGGDVPD